MAEIEIVCEGLAFPEGPVAMPDGSVILVEIKAGRLTRVAPDGTKSTVAEVGGGPNGLAVGPDGALYVCNNGGFIWTEIGEMNIPVGPGGVSQPPEYTSGSIQRVDIETGEVTTVYTACGENKLNGTARLVRRVVPMMRERRWGRIINFSGGAARTPRLARIGVSMNNAAVLTLTKALASDLAKDNILVNAILPQGIASERLVQDVTPAAGKTARQVNNPLGRIGSSQEISGLVAFLASERASFITGAAFTVDGGVFPSI